jgi:hypothetical protein
VVGIRSLPNALKPNFRQTLLKQVMPTTTKHSATESGTGTGESDQPSESYQQHLGLMFVVEDEVISPDIKRLDHTQVVLRPCL